MKLSDLRGILLKMVFDVCVQVFYIIIITVKEWVIGLGANKERTSHRGHRRFLFSFI